ncbi:MAG: DUF2934 domain-containing protein [Alphaproteobacteria bacterium]
MSQPTDYAIRDRAYHIWEREGRPQGRERDHWLQAAWELRGEHAAQAAAKAQAATPKKAKAAAKPNGKANPARAKATRAKAATTGTKRAGPKAKKAN